MTKLVKLGIVSAGANANSESGGVWFGTDGPYTSEFINNAKEDLILVIWGSSSSWVNTHKPLITYSLPQGTSVTISFAEGQSGAWSAIYSDTELYNGQIRNSWGEYTFTPEGVVDVSLEVYMDGHTMSIVGPSCTTDMNTCVFQCPPGQTSCEDGYVLNNCTPPPQGSQAGAQYGFYDGNPSGGCGWPGATTVSLTTTFS